MVPRMKEEYAQDVVPALMKKFSYGNIMMVPRLEKITVNMGVGEAFQNPKALEEASATLRTITGQQPTIRKARVSIANFKLREGMKVGTMVTLRRDMMWEFYDRLVSMAIPRIRDFRGLPTTCFDGRGNYTLGLREQIAFPEVNMDRLSVIRGMNITLVTTAGTDEEGLEFLRLLKFPFRRN
ncbi:MAG: 50S ribosomal protein L5 [Gemmatimonadota bacterium]|nr:50S ribosomal protein L5 [Gemmatimonadota bacterium]MDP6803407.1 50S ribosomal protein L5 [Gemmatimonadota bacterium]MDP7032384.1 50S ribosomal protein L5 [Gemmatimonadota bacterium]